MDNNKNCLLKIERPKIVRGTLKVGGFFDTDLKIGDVIVIKNDTLYILRPSRKRNQHLLIDSNFATKGLLKRFINPTQISIPDQEVLVGILNLVSAIGKRALVNLPNGHTDNNGIFYPIAYIIGSKKKRGK